MARACSLVLGDRAAGDLKQPRREALLVAKTRQPALDADKHVLQDIVELRGIDPAREERPELCGHVLPGRGRWIHAQHSGPQHESGLAAPPGLRASIVADATNRSIPGSQAPTISALRGAIVTAASTNPAAASIARTSSSGAAPATQPASAAAAFCSSAGIGAVATTSLIARRPPARSTRNASRNTA